MNITVPFKRKVINYLDDLSFEAEKTQSVNTIYFKNNRVVGHNTDIEGFEMAIKNLKFNIKGKKIFILGAGGVVPSIIFALNRMKVSEIVISNRTKTKAEELNNLFKNLKIINWGVIPEFDVIINATSIGLNKNDEINLDFTKIGKRLGNEIENGKLMFIYQAFLSFNLWHGVRPKINNEIIKLLNND